MPAFLVRLNGAAIPLDGEFREAWTAETWHQRLPSTGRFRPNRHASPSRPI